MSPRLREELRSHGIALLDDPEPAGPGPAQVAAGGPRAAGNQDDYELLIEMIHEGTLEVTISGRSAKLGPGSVAYVASGEEHGWRNVGTTRAQYFVLALGQEK